LFAVASRNAAFLNKPSSTLGFRVTQLVQRECSAVPSKKPSARGRPPSRLAQPASSALGRPFPPTLARAESEFKKLCDELGGPADIGVKIDRQYMEICCQEHPADSLLPLLLRFQEDQSVARRHWPWVAFAISQYAFERSERTEYSDEPKPKEIIEILEQIRQSARDLGSGLSRLQALSARLTDPAAPLRRAHLVWLNDRISAAIAGRISNDVNEDELQKLVDDSKKMRLLRQLADVEVAANVAREHVDKSLLNRERSQSDPALPNFIFRCGGIWKSLTRRKPSAAKVDRMIQPSEPDFVIFVQELAKSAGFDPPSRDQVATSLRKFRPCD
jgi:hypothetical protein